MTGCSCMSHKTIEGVLADEYVKNYLTRISYKNGGWTQLWQCKHCGSFWEMTWENCTGGFDTGVPVLRKLSDSEKEKRWTDFD